MLRNGVRSLGGFVLLSCVAVGSSPLPVAPPTGDLRSLVDLRSLIDEMQADRGALGRFFPLEGSSARSERLGRWATDGLARLAALDFAGLDPESRIDWLCLRDQLEGER